MAAHVTSPSPKQTLSLPPHLPQDCQEGVRKPHSLRSPDPLGSVFGPILSSTPITKSLSLHFVREAAGRETSLLEVRNGRWILGWEGAFRGGEDGGVLCLGWDEVEWRDSMPEEGQAGDGGK